MIAASQPQGRTAGAPQALVLIFCMLMPVAGIVSLAPNLPQLMDHFHEVAKFEFLVPMIITIPALCNAVFSPFVGALADAIGRRRLLVGALLLHAVAGLSALLLDDLYAILATRLFVGVAEATIMTVSNALIGDYYDEVQRKKWLAYQSVIGPILASALVLAGGALGSLTWRGPFALYLLSLIAFCAALVVTWEPAKRAAATRGAPAAAVHFPWPTMALVGAVTLFTSTLYFVQPLQLGRIFHELGVTSPARISVVMTIASAGVVLGGFTYRRIGHRSVAVMLALVYMLWGIGLIALSLASDFRQGIPFAAICQVSNGMTIPTLVSWALSKLSFEHRGRGMGIWNSCFFAGQFANPFLIGLGTKVTGGLLPTMLGAGVIGLAAAVVAFALSRRVRPQRALAGHA